MDIVDTVDGVAVRFVGLQVIGDVDPLNDENVVFLADISGRFGPEFSVRCVNLTRLQRASKGSG
jgi:hypothetical protein